MLAPSVFDADERGLGVVIAVEIGEADLDAARLAVANCPESAIFVEPSVAQ